jgi:hypothetical protein
VSVLGFACVLLPYSCSELHSYTRKQISFPALFGDDGSVLRGRFSLGASRYWLELPGGIE